ncbi:hypothetical protein D9M69_728380 [compost metagenome]
MVAKMPGASASMLKASAKSMPGGRLVPSGGELNTNPTAAVSRFCELANSHCRQSAPLMPASYGKLL